MGVNPTDSPEGAPSLYTFAVSRARGRAVSFGDPEILLRNLWIVNEWLSTMQRYRGPGFRTAPNFATPRH
jgi:hypothetical protein